MTNVLVTARRLAAWAGGTVFRSNPRIYSDLPSGIQAGHLAVPCQYLRDHGTPVVEVVAGGLYRCEVLELGLADFLKRYQPDFRFTTVPAAAKAMLKTLSTWIQVVPPARERLLACLGATDDAVREEDRRWLAARVAAIQDLMDRGKLHEMVPYVHGATAATRLRVHQDGNWVSALGIVDGCVDLVQHDAEVFTATHRVATPYPAPRAWLAYAIYAQQLGVTPEAAAILQPLFRLIDGEIPMTPKKVPARKAPAAKKAAAKKPAAKKTAAKKPAARTRKTDAVPETAAAVATDRAGKVTAASRFKELILGGELTDDQIFAAVAAEFGLDDKKRSYVAWYRNSLRKAGHAVPAAVTVDDPV